MFSKEGGERNLSRRRQGISAALLGRTEILPYNPQKYKSLFRGDL